MIARDYQAEDVEKIFEEWKTVQSTLYVAATGLGKTFTMSEVVKRAHPKRAIILAHRSELISQARNAFYKRGIDCEVEQAGQVASTTLWNRQPVVLATVQTLLSGSVDRKRMQRFDPKDFGVLLYDECFPAGTLIDGIPIEKLKIGDEVKSVSPYRISKQKVIHFFKRKCDALVRVKFSSGRSLICTPNHPIWSETISDFKPALMLDKYDVVFRLTTEYDISNYLQKLCGFIFHRKPESKALFSRVCKRAVQIANGCDQQKVCVETNDRKQPHAPKGVEGKDVNDASGNGSQASYSRRQWKASVRTGNEAGVGSWLGNWFRRCYQYASRKRNPKSLQNRRCESSIENRTGSGRVQPLIARSKRAGQKEGEFSGFDRVDSVEVLEQTSDGTFGGMCPDGHVYNIEVENTCTYFADGCLVHNSHHAVSTGNKSIVDYFTQGNPDIKVLGVTATPSRSDEKALGQIFQSVAAERDILWGISNGWLVPIEQLFVPVSGLDYSEIRTTAGDLNGADLSRVLENESNLQGMVQPTLEAVFGLPEKALNKIPTADWGNYLSTIERRKRTIVFTASVAQAEAMSNIFNRVIPTLSCWLCGKTDDQSRKLIFDDFGCGRSTILVNCGVATEGYDNPYVELIVMARPTKSETLYRQMVGRGTRTLPGLIDDIALAVDRVSAIAQSSKPFVTIMDFVGNSGRHKLMSTANILGGNASDEAIELAEKKAKEKGVRVNMAKELEEAEEEIRKKIEVAREREESRKRKIVLKAKYTTQRISPFDALDIMPVRDRGWDSGKQLSEGQRKVLLRAGVNPDGMSYAQGKQLVTTVIMRWKNKKSTVGQCSLLKRFGYQEAPKMSFTQASALITKIKENKWKRIET